MHRLAGQGFSLPFTTLEEGVKDYTLNYLLNKYYY
jgi:hypothetical protein